MFLAMNRLYREANVSSHEHAVYIERRMFLAMNALYREANVSSLEPTAKGGDCPLPGAYSAERGLLKPSPERTVQRSDCSHR